MKRYKYFRGSNKNIFFKLNCQTFHLQIFCKINLKELDHKHIYFTINTSKKIITKTSVKQFIYTVVYSHIKSTSDIFTNTSDVNRTNFISNLLFNFSVIVTINFTTNIANYQACHMQFRIFGILFSGS